MNGLFGGLRIVECAGGQGLAIPQQEFALRSLFPAEWRNPVSVQELS